MIIVRFQWLAVVGKGTTKYPHWRLKTSLQLFSNIIRFFKSQSKSWILHRICILLGFKTQQHLSPWLTSTKSTPNRTYLSSYTKNENQERHAWSNHPKCIPPGVRVLVPPVARNLMCRAPMPSSYSAQTEDGFPAWHLFTAESNPQPQVIHSVIAISLHPALHRAATSCAANMAAYGDDLGITGDLWG